MLLLLVVVRSCLAFLGLIALLQGRLWGPGMVGGRMDWTHSVGENPLPTSTSAEGAEK